jgi:hypothetical protein
MMTSWFKAAPLASIAFAALTACSGAGDMYADDSEVVDESELMSLDQVEEAAMSCTNPDGTNAAMAALAVAVAQDLGRLQTGVDFVQGYNAGEIVALGSGSNADGPIGKSRCADGKCARVQAILDMQLDAAANKVWFQGTGSTKVLLNPQALRTRMLGKWREQKDFDARAKDGVADQAPKELHKLAYVSAAKGGCDTNFTFKATTTSGGVLKYPNQLKYKLAFADIYNPYINFTNLGNGNISIDPTYGLNPDGSTTTGTCTAACTKISTTSVAGQCCSCGGVNKAYVKATFNANTYLCQ